MTAIAGVLNLHGDPVGGQVATAISVALETEGPDGTSVCDLGAVVLAAASYVTVRGVGSPLSDDDAAGVTVVMTGRLDNRSEIRRDARRHGLQLPESASDAEHVRAAYAMHRDLTPSRLLGDWAFLLWDAAAGRLFAARDHIGGRPLVWWRNDATCVIASSLRAALAHPSHRAEPNDGLIAEYLAGRPATVTETLWKGVNVLRAGHALVLERGGALRQWAYWDPWTDAAEPYRALADAAEALREAVGGAVRDRLSRAAGTPWVQLSGGLDSTTVAAVAGREARDRGIEPPPLVNYDTAGIAHADERPYLEAAEQHLGQRAMRQPVLEAAPEQDLQLIRQSRSAFPREPLFRHLRDGDCAVCLTGEHGDEFLAALTDPLTLLFTRGPMRDAARALGGRRAVVSYLLRDTLRDWAPRRLRVARQPTITPLLPEAFVGRNHLRERYADAELLLRRGTARQRALVRHLGSFNLQQAALHGLGAHGRYAELVNPLSDLRVVRVALRTPVDVGGGFYDDYRRLHRAAFARDLPPLIAQRTSKAQFQEVFARQSARRLATIGGAPNLVDRGWVDADEARAALDPTSGKFRSSTAILLYYLETWSSTLAR